MMKSLGAGYNVLIVGASRGIGLALARVVASDMGVGQIFCASRVPEKATDVHALAENDCRVRALRMDITDEATIAAACAEIEQHAGRLHLVLVTAGVLHDGASMRPERRLQDVNAETALASFGVNALGPLLVLKHVAPLLAPESRAVFASLSARVGSIGDNRMGGWYAYRAAKAAQNQFVHTAAIELGRRLPELVCVTLHPGTVDTALSKPFQARVKPDKLFSTERASRQLLGVLDGLKPEHSGRFFAWDGEAIPW